MSSAVDRVEECHEQSSMDYWWPKLESLDVPTPATKAVPMDKPVPYEGDRSVTIADPDAVADAVNEVGGPPAFIRTDQSSNKHAMGRSSRLPNTDRETIVNHQCNVLEDMLLSFGAPNSETLYVREWLDLWHEFKTFEDGTTPIAAELRWFIDDGDIHDWAFYWPKESVWAHSATVEDWPAAWERTLCKAKEHVAAAKHIVSRVATEFDGYWSVDVALTADEEWFVIDMARGELSWHPEAVEQLRGDPREELGDTDD